MNRWLILLVGCMLLAAGAVLLIVRFPPAMEPVAYIPQEAVAVVEWNKAGHLWQQWPSGIDGGKPGQAGLGGLVARMELGQDLLDGLNRAGTLIAAIGRQPGLQTLVDGRAVLAFVPDRSEGPLTVETLRNRWLLVVETEVELTPLLAAEVLGPMQSRQVAFHQGELLETLVFQDGRTLTWWRQGTVAVCSRQASLVRQCIDQSLRRMISTSSGLLENRAYRRLKGLSRQGTDLFCFLDVEQLGNAVPGLLRIGAEEDLVLHHLALMHSAQKDSQWLNFAALADAQRLEALTERHRLPVPHRGVWFNQGDDEAIFSLWTNWFQPKRWWNVLVEHAHPNFVSLMASVGQQLADLTDKPIDAFFDVLGDGFGVFITEQAAPNQSNRFFGCLTVAIRDRSLIEAALKRLLADVQVITVKSGGLDVVTIMLAGGLLQPAYTLTDRYLVIADRVELVEQAARQIGSAADSVDPNGEGLNHGEIGNFFLFVQAGALIDRLVPPLTLMAKESDERDRMLSAESRRFVRETALPLLQALRSVNTGRLRAAVTGDTLQLEIEYTLNAP